MNAHAKIYMDETKLSVRRALDDAIAVYRNEDTIMREKAIDAIIEGRAAYWTTASYHAATNSGLPHYLNAGVEIERAVDEAYPDWRFAFNPELQKQKRRAALDTIIPLNMKAAIALSAAYSAKGIWKDEPELLMRAVRDTRPRAA